MFTPFLILRVQAFFVSCYVGGNITRHLGRRVKTRAEMRLGELTAAMPKSAGNQYTKSASSSHDEKALTKAEALSRAKINRTQASQYELMAAHPDVVEQAIAEARANDDIVSRSQVLSKIKVQKKAEQIAQA